MPKLTPEQLEQLIHRTLHDLPPRPAPATLEARVHAALAARAAAAALPWWRQSVFSWPPWARVLFGVAAGAAILAIALGGALVLGGTLPAEIGAVFAPVFAGIERVAAGVRGLIEFCQLVVRPIPPELIYGALAAAAIGYGALFSFGAAAYRMLRAPRRLP